MALKPDYYSSDLGWAPKSIWGEPKEWTPSKYTALCIVGLKTRFRISELTLDGPFSLYRNSSIMRPFKKALNRRVGRPLFVLKTT